MQEEKIEIDGEVTAALPTTVLRVRLSPYDLNRGRIIYRYK